jgi:hypothetical protein
MSERLEQILDDLNTFCTAVFILEAALKIFAKGAR